MGVKVAFFDVDGTLPLINPGAINEAHISRIKKILDMHEVLRTVVTGCGFYRTMNLFNGCKFLSEEIPLILENGSRLVWFNGNVLLERQLSEEEIEFLIETIDRQLDLVDFVSFFPRPLEKANFLLWSEVGKRLARGAFVGRKTTDPDKFYRWLREQPVPTHVLVRSSQGISLAGLQAAPGGYFSNITTQGVDKALGVRVILNILGIAPHEAVYAGNDANDRSVFTSPLLAEMKKIVVGNSPALMDIEADFRVSDPSQLEVALFDVCCGECD